MDATIDTRHLGLATHFDGPNTKGNRDRQRWRVRFDTGIEMLVPDKLFEKMVFHLEENDPKPPRVF